MTGVAEGASRAYAIRELYFMLSTWRRQQSVNHFASVVGLRDLIVDCEKLECTIELDLFSGQTELPSFCQQTDKNPVCFRFQWERQEGCCSFHEFIDANEKQDHGQM